VIIFIIFYHALFYQKNKSILVENTKNENRQKFTAAQLLNEFLKTKNFVYPNDFKEIKNRVPSNFKYFLIIYLNIFLSGFLIARYDF
jgi:hypothetical protein